MTTGKFLNARIGWIRVQSERTGKIRVYRPLKSGRWRYCYTEED